MIPIPANFDLDKAIELSHKEFVETLELRKYSSQLKRADHIKKDVLIQYEKDRKREELEEIMEENIHRPYKEYNYRVWREKV